MSAPAAASDQRFRTAPPASRSLGTAIVDSYTGYLWCGAGLHLLTPENRQPSGRCRPCQTRRRRTLRGRKR